MENIKEGLHMDHKFMDALDIVKEDLIKEGMPVDEARALIDKIIWILVCRL